MTISSLASHLYKENGAICIVPNEILHSKEGLSADDGDLDSHVMSISEILACVVRNEF